MVAASAGNHAQGVAYAARALGSRAVIVMPEKAPAIKKAKTLELGAEVITVDGGSEEDWRITAEDLADRHGLTMVPPFNSSLVLLVAVQTYILSLIIVVLVQIPLPSNLP